MHYSPVRRSSARIATPATARLACVKHAASVQSEPGSNSSLEAFELSTKKSELKPIAGLFGHSVIDTKVHDASPHTNYLPNF
jgi:hypothetical protein